VEVELAGLPREVEGVNRDAVAAKAGARIVRYEDEWLGGRLHTILIKRVSGDPAENGKYNAHLPMSIDLDFGVIKRIRSGFGADLVEFMKADASYFSLSIANVLFLYRNVQMYLPLNAVLGNNNTSKRYTPIGINYLPIVSVGYVIKF
jgi:hypothetical protein